MGGSRFYEDAMRTTIYVDGFNLYYGCLKNTKYRWLNLEELFRNILQDDHKIEKIHYFTAKLKSLSHDSTTLDRQKAYLNALRTLPAVKIHYGHFAIRQKSMPKAEPPHERVEVIKTEEKGSDVNLSVHLLNDAWLDRYDCAIVVTNYSDMTEALKLVKQEFPQKSIGLISPFKTHTSGLKRYAKSCEIISEQALHKSQFPSPAHSPSGKRYYKPEGW